MEKEFDFRQEALGEMLRKARHSCHLSLRELAKASGLSAGHICRIESGEFEIQLPTFVRLAVPLGVPCGTILERAISVNVMHYLQAVKEDPELTPFIPRDGLKSKKAIEERDRRGLLFLCNLCAGLSYLLKSSNPVRLVEAIDFPTQNLKTQFARAAEEIHSTYDSFSRISDLDDLRKFPAQVLTKHQVLTKELVAEAFSGQGRESASAPWAHPKMWRGSEIADVPPGK